MISPLFILEGRNHTCGWTLAWSSRFLWTAMALFWRAFSARMAAGFCCSFCGRRCPHVWKLRDLTCIFSPISSDMVGSFVQRNRLSIPFRGGVNVLLYTFTLFLMKSGKFVSPGGQNCAWNRSDAEKKTVVLSFACGDSSPILNCRENLSLWRGTSNTANLIGDKCCTDRRMRLQSHGSLSMETRQNYFAEEIKK